MIDFLKHLLHNRHRQISFLLIDDDAGPESSSSFKFKPVRLVKWFIASLSAILVLTLLLVMFTPLGGMLYSQEDAALKKQAVEISQQVQALQDSLRARDNQLREMKQIMAAGIDTNFSVAFEGEGILQNNLNTSELEQFYEVKDHGMLSENEIIFSNTFKKVPEFPADYPVEGTFTRGYDPENEHYGVDIAAEEGKSFKAIADGAVINQDWTLNYGFVLHVQHGNGIVAIYKHAKTLNKSVGDVVLKGDILGTIGDVGIVSSGPHLHIEIWKDGIPQNPNTYLIKS